MPLRSLVSVAVRLEADMGLRWFLADDGFCSGLRRVEAGRCKLDTLFSYIQKGFWLAININN
jgi:hypothetical protein